MKFNIGKISIGAYSYNIFSKSDRKNRRFKELELSIWFRRDKVVGQKNFKDVKNWNMNLVNSYMFGINLIIFKFWINISRGAKVFEIKS